MILCVTLVLASFRAVLPAASEARFARTTSSDQRLKRDGRNIHEPVFAGAGGIGGHAPRLIAVEHAARPTMSA
jgi:hypothetical protein